MATTRPNSAEEVKDIRHAARSLFRKNPLSIGRRLTVCFLIIVVSMVAADAVVFWHFSRMVASSRRLSNADQTSLAIVRLRLDVGTFRQNVAALESGHATEQFSTQAAGLQQSFLRNVEDAQQALSKAPEIAREDPTIPAALETLKVTVPSQLDTAVLLATAGDWNAIRLRLEHQIQDLIDLSSSLVKKMDRQAQQQRTKAIEDAETARHGLLVVLVIAGLLTLILAAALGWYATQSITVPLSELASGAQVLARGDLSHQVSVYGNDELAVVGRAFNHAARQLRELYEELREQASLLSLTHDAIYVRDVKGVIRYWNHGAEELYGWPAEYALGKVARELLKAIPSLPFEQIEAELLRTGRWEGELVKAKKDGTQLVVASRWSLKRDDRGEPVAILVTSNDITERKRAEEALRRLNRELRAISNCNQTLLRATDEQSLLEEICRIVCEEAGYRMAWVGYAEHDEAKSVRTVACSGAEEGYLANLGITWGDTERGRGPTGTAIRSGKSSCIQDFATDPRLAAWQESVLQHDFRSGIALPLKDEHANAFGSLTIYSAQPDAFTSEEIRLLEELAGDLAFGIVTLRSRAARKQTEEALRESETRFRTFVDHAGDALFVYDLEQRTIFDVNRQACESLGYTREELIGNTPLAFHTDSYQAEMESVVERAAAGETVFDTHWHRRKDGSMFPVEVHTTLVSYGGRRFLLMVARDISDRVRAEEQRERLRQLEADLAHINRVSMMGELAASIAHEVNQPLSGVVSNGGACLRWLAGDAPNMEEAREAARRIVRDGKRAGEIIARIRALTKKASAPREQLDLNETLREVLALVGDQAKKNSVMIRTQFADDVFPVLGDQVQLQQVVLNLVMNAIEAMSSVGERARELVITTRSIDPDQVQVTVEDSGIGLDPNTIAKIFDPFYTTKPGGMGMGLSISRSIVQAHGGRLWATAKDGPGTIFYFTLPKYHKEEAHEEEPHAGVAGV